MEFTSIEDANNFYVSYAKKKGFSFRMGRITRSRMNDIVIGQEMLCSKEGFKAKKYAKNENERYAPRDETRVGCKAMIYVKKKEEMWIISRFVRDHNHQLFSPRSSQFLRVHKKKTKVQKKLIDVLDDSGLPPSKMASVLCVESCGINNVGFGKQDVITYLSGKRQKQLEKGDAQLMLMYFQNCQLKNPGFFYAFQMDIDGQLENCFWVDLRSRMAYKYFGDIVTFDPTYLTNRYKMPFVPFTGVNHHQQSILFGCALLWDETEESFVWLLNTWLKAMSGVRPKSIITYQDTTITNAVARVFPEVSHHYCMLHIEKKAQEYLSHIYNEHGEFKNQFYRCIHQSVTIEYFESDWEAMIDKYELHDNGWLEKIYSIREKWISAYVRHSFCFGMSTTQRSESMNKFFKDFLNSSTSLSKFVAQYEKAIDARYNKEREKTFKSVNSKPILRTLYPMEEEASKTYTRKLFRIFQDELVASQIFIVEKVEFSNDLSTYKVHGIYQEGPNYYVSFHVISKGAYCSCHKFEFLGILCTHILVVFIRKRIYSLPSQYILHRWTLNAKKENVQGLKSVEFQEGRNKASSTLLFNNVMVHSLELSERASRSEKHHDIAIQGMQKLIADLDQLEVEESKEDFGNLTNQIILKNSNNAITLCDPPIVATKGRPRTLQMKGSLELLKKGSFTCSNCKKKGHKKPKCPSLNQTRCNIVNGQFENSNAKGL
ncbi:PREDICTED: protein FAR1-RELATED SEQUENCE 5-like [Lupinus angustifolius]|uniref:protein FAR1-RELATED SEQUENCE 5-like n=1 Tax=Lupinus angustifolius TaxID=3871 RepID=UPI00092E8AE2|nr:PREDICTED: protein FAR1-RELATED SEQUENCE 5-like [Lupinus angustifolius]